MEENMPKMHDEPKVVFKSISDRDVFQVTNEDTGHVLVEISGYDLQINFNMQFIKTMEDIETAISGMGELWRREILKQLLQVKNEQNE